MLVSSRLERPNLDVARPAPRLRKIIRGLQPEPGFGARTESLGQPDRHLDGDSRLSIQQIGERLPRHPEAFRGLSDREAKRLQALTAHDAAGMRRVMHQHWRLLSDNRDSPRHGPRLNRSET